MQPILAVTKEGLVSGTWFNRSTDKSVECEGQVFRIPSGSRCAGRSGPT
ncbi:MAG: hypothetical protein L0Y71_11620 [Gemmataceae bacterium]|nr:hypothetical protein [Gemmataceae bacterium]